MEPETAFRCKQVLPLRLQFHRLLWYESGGLKLGAMTELSMSSLPDQPEELTTLRGMNLKYRWSAIFG